MTRTYKDTHRMNKADLRNPFIVNTKNVKYVAQAIDTVVRECPAPTATTSSTSNGK